MLISQIKGVNGEIIVAVREQGGAARSIKNAVSVYALAMEAADGGKSLASVIEAHGAAIGVFGQRLAQQLRLVVLAGDEMNVLLDLVGSLTWRRDFDLDGIDEIFAGKIGDRLRHVEAD